MHADEAEKDLYPIESGWPIPRAGRVYDPEKAFLSAVEEAQLENERLRENTEGAKNPQ